MCIKYARKQYHFVFGSHLCDVSLCICKYPQTGDHLKYWAHLVLSSSGKGFSAIFVSPVSSLLWVFFPLCEPPEVGISDSWVIPWRNEKDHAVLSSYLLGSMLKNERKDLANKALALQAWRPVFDSQPPCETAEHGWLCKLLIPVLEGRGRRIPGVRWPCQPSLFGDLQSRKRPCPTRPQEGGMISEDGV